MYLWQAVELEESQQCLQEGLLAVYKGKGMRITVQETLLDTEDMYDIFVEYYRGTEVVDTDSYWIQQGELQHLPVGSLEVTGLTEGFSNVMEIGRMYSEADALAGDWETVKAEKWYVKLWRKIWKRS